MIGQEVVERWLRLLTQRDVGDGKGVVGAQWWWRSVVSGVCWKTAWGSMEQNQSERG